MKNGWIKKMWNENDNWKNRQFDLFRWWSGAPIIDMTELMTEELREDIKQHMRIHVYGEWDALLERGAYR